MWEKMSFRHRQIYKHSAKLTTETDRQTIRCTQKEKER